MAAVLATTSAEVGSGEPQELVDLVAGDVGDDAAEPGAVVEPVGSADPAGEVGRVTLPVRPEPDGLDDLADPARPDQFVRRG